MTAAVDARRARFIERGGVLPSQGTEASRLLEALLASGDLLPDLLAGEGPGALDALLADPFLWQPKPRAELSRAVDEGTEGATDFADFKRRLRLVRRREVLRMGARELGWGTTAEVARELAAFADACLEAAYRFADAELRRELGTPIVDEPGEPPPRFVVMGMGKLGGDELNFSSDVDVIYFYSTDAGHVEPPPGAPAGSSEISLHRFYSDLSRRITAALDDLTGEGLVFRVDLRLRPESRSGPMCNSLAAAERYYETFGRTWERQAWLRARPSAGDKALGEELLAILEPFIYPRHAEERTLAEIRALRAQFRDPADAGGGLAGGREAGFDVKLGSGGIRDVELVVQTLQLLHGGKRPDIRERNTPRALHRLVVAGLLTNREAQTLSTAYRFWRQLEHRVMVAEGAQTHRLPGDAEARAALAATLGYDLASFDAAVTRERRAVERIAATFADESPGPLEEAARLVNPLLERDALERLLAEAGFAEPERSADAIEVSRPRLPAAFVAEAIASPSPDRALTHFRDLALHGSPGLMALLRDQPQLLRMLGTLFGTSDRLSELLVRHPAMWEPLVASLGARLRTADELHATLGAELSAATADAPSDDAREEDALRAVRRFQAHELLRIGLHDVAGSLDAGEVTDQLTLLAEACLEASIGIVWPGLVRRLGAPRTGLTVLALGSLGAREMRYGSDLDLVFLFGEDGESTTGVTHQEWFARASQRVIGALETLLEEGRLYQVDTGLRPSGAQGLLVTSTGSFARYHERDAAAWERVALLRARVVHSSEPAARRVEIENMLEAIAFDRPFDEPRFRAELREMRARVERERANAKGPSGRHVRFAPGGVMDVEFLVALGQLTHAADEGVRTTETSKVLDRLVLLGWPSALRDDYAFLRLVALRLRLLHDRPVDVLGRRDTASLARMLDLDPAALTARLDTVMKRVRTTFDAFFGGVSGEN
jgi:glutamate-ammonia-ligase adenylyltransferase